MEGQVDIADNREEEYIMRKVGFALLFICIGVLGTLFFKSFQSPSIKLLDNSLGNRHRVHYYIELASDPGVGINTYLIMVGMKGDLWPFSGTLKAVPREEFSKKKFIEKIY